MHCTGLIKEINSLPLTIFNLAVINVSIWLYLEECLLGMLMALFFVTITFKLYKFNSVMFNANKVAPSLVANEEFTREALIITCMSIFLEIFAQLFISLTTAFGYMIVTY